MRMLDVHTGVCQKCCEDVRETMCTQVYPRRVCKGGHCGEQAVGDQCNDVHTNIVGKRYVAVGRLRNITIWNLGEFRSYVELE